MNPNVAKLINGYKENNQDGAIITLWEDFQPLVASYMRKFYIPLEKREDVKQDAFLQLLECAQNYEPSQGVPFESYYKMNLHYWFLNRIRKKSELLVIDHGWSNGCSMTDLMESTMGNAQEYIEVRETQTEVRETQTELEEALEELTHKQRQAVTMFYLQGISLIEIAKKMGCSYKVAYKHKDAGIKKIRKRWGLGVK